MSGSASPARKSFLAVKQCLIFPSGNVSVEHGPFYAGKRTAFGFTGARLRLNAHLAFEPRVQINRVVPIPSHRLTAKRPDPGATGVS